jgi:hypothetical protein
MAPEQTETTIIAGARRARTEMSDTDQKALEVDKIFENSPDFWFYSSKPISGAGGKPNLIVYHVNAVRDDGTCIAQILVNESHPEDEIRRIAMSVKRTCDPLLAKQVTKNTKCFVWCRLHVRPHFVVISAISIRTSASAPSKCNILGGVDRGEVSLLHCLDCLVERSVDRGFIGL